MFKKIHWRAIAILALLFALLYTTCELEGTSDTDTGRVVDRIHAKEPVITAQPAVGLALAMGGSVTPLAVTAEAQEEDGVLSYRWLRYADPAAYENNTGTNAPGASATSGSFSPPVTQEGVFYYAVTVTNTLDRATGNKTASVKSGLAVVTVNDPNNAEYPTITALSGSGYYIAASGLSVTLSVTAAVADSGNVTYKWFSSDEPAVTGGTEVPSATAASFTLPSAVAGTYYYYVTVNNNKAGSGRADSAVSSLFTVNVVSANATFTVNTATTYQFVRGFGGMYTPWDNAPQENLGDFERMYNPDLMGLNMLRIMILPDSTDIEDTMNKLTTGRDGDKKDQSFYYEAVKIANKYGGYVLASPWSPPAAWKTNGDIIGGGTLRTNNYRNFALYLKDFCQLMYNKGAPIYAVSMQNEPTFPTTEYAGCEYDTVQHKNWWLQAYASTTNQNEPFTFGVPGWGGGAATARVLTMSGEAHNNVSPFHTDASSALQTEEARKFMDIVGRHNYGAGVNPIPDNQRHGKEVWMTEHNLNTQNNYSIDSTWNLVWKFMNDIDLTLRFNNENAFIWWTAKRFYSFLGDGQQGTTNGVILPRGYGISHYARFAKEMTRVAVTGSGTTAGGVTISNSNFNGSSFNIDSLDAKVSAYKSADGKEISLVMFTPTDLNGGGGSDMGTVKIQLPADFTVSRATAMRSNNAARGVMESVIICVDKKSAIVTLPRSEILSVKFFGE